MTLLAYLLKVIVVSAVLYGYYRLFLRNKRFHHYNRFFLLSALLLSIVLPFIRITLLYQPENPVNDAVYRTVSVINVEYDPLPGMPAEPVDESIFTLVNSIYLLYAVGVMFLLTLVVRSLMYIQSLRKRYPAEKITSLSFYNTHEPGTPFSFFRSIFWNDQLSINSREGQQIFRHELFHVQHQHSADRLLSELLTAVFWFNPFFHLIKKELKAIHEFLADQFAMSGSDRHDYAALLVQQALESGKHTVTNHFFQNHIKRRIAMITQFQKSKYGYWSRVMVLPLSLVLFCFVTLYAKKPSITPVEKNIAPVAVAETAGILVADDQDRPKRTASRREQNADTIPARSERERELQKVREEQQEMLRRKMRDREEVMKKAQREELDDMKKQMREQEMLSRELENHREKQREELMRLQEEMREHRQRLNEKTREQAEEMRQLMREHEMRLKDDPDYRKKSDARLEELRRHMRDIEEETQHRQREQDEMMRAKMRELEMRSHQQNEQLKMRQESFLNMQHQLKEKELMMRKQHQKEIEHYKEELQKQREQERRIKEEERERMREKQRDDQRQESSFKLRDKMQNRDVLAQKMKDQYVTDLHYPQQSIKSRTDPEFVYTTADWQPGSIKKPSVVTETLFQDTIPAKPATKARLPLKPAPYAKEGEPYKDAKKLYKAEKLSSKAAMSRMAAMPKPAHLERVAPMKKRVEIQKPARVQESRIQPEKPRKSKTKLFRKGDGSGQIPEENKEENYSEISVNGLR